MQIECPTFMRDLSARLVGAIFYAGIMLYAALQGSWPLLMVFFVASILMAYELLAVLELKRNLGNCFLSIALLASLFALAMIKNITNAQLAGLGGIIGVWLLFSFYLAVGQNKRPGFIPAVLFYIGAPLLVLLFGSDCIKNYRPSLLLILFYLIWCSDVMAYFTGRFLGKRPLASSISPNKTLEGSLGGIAFPLIGLPFFLHLLNEPFDWRWLSVGLFTIISGILGDLFESQLKRMASIKDSGDFLPGHGGLLDRMDSLLFASPFYILSIVVSEHLFL